MRRGFTADYFQFRSPILERTVRAQCRSPQAPFTCCFDKYVLQWMGEDAFDVQYRTSPVGHNVIVLAARIAERWRSCT